MKTSILNKLLLGLIITFFLYSCKPDKDTSIDPDNIIMNYADEPIHTLEARLIDAMTNGYKNNQLKVINSNITFDNDPKEQGDAQYVEFDLETLKMFIYQIEKSAIKSDSTISDKDLGIRMYYAAYPRYEDWKNYPDLQDKDFLKDTLTKQYGLRHTLVMQPIIQKNGDSALFGFQESAEGATLRTMSVESSGSGSRNSKNHGSLWPPATTDGN